jgi:hypothetical protein
VKLLLDTATFLWIVAGAPELSQHARELFADPDTEVRLSAVSTWEIALKHALGGSPFRSRPSVSSRPSAAATASTRYPWTRRPPSTSLGCPGCPATRS